MGYPDQAAGSNSQGITTMFWEGDNGGGMVKHEDQHRGASYSFIEQGESDKLFNSVNPDFFQLVPWEGVGYKPVGYGFESFSNAVK